jgi:hypothetical protein
MADSDPSFISLKLRERNVCTVSELTDSDSKDVLMHQC